MTTDFEITDLLPDTDNREFGDPIYPDLIGATIKAFGAPIMALETDRGLLAIEYQPKGLSQTKRVVMAFDQSRIWFLSDSQISAANEAKD